MGDRDSSLEDDSSEEAFLSKEEEEMHDDEMLQCAEAMFSEPVA